MDADSPHQEITALVGREVYSNNGVFVGEVEDLRLDLDSQQVTGLALHQINASLFSSDVADARGVIVPYRWVQAVGDVILVNSIVERHDQSPEDDDAEVAA